ncbi:MAG: aromatic ring-hydroxylating dioxygenase subunit alpha [Xanthomonadales bacterium]|nr:aromatic ring-hydroxylating dioxygenase subunit alpha [Xanthomonadales bacterium]
MKAEEITRLAADQRPHYSLEQPFYLDADIYERDIERIFLRSWLYAGHQSEIPNVGDWFLFKFAEESVIVVRSAADQVNALVNVCRHRGSRVCVQPSGCSKRLTCPYHGWTYDLEGKLRAAAHMGDDFDKTGIGLKRISVERLDGMIFVNFADQPAAFEPVRDGLSEVLRPYGLENAKVAHRQSYVIAANWKLGVENYCECYHCAPAHPEYSRGHSIAQPQMRDSELGRKVMARAKACGLSEKVVNEVYLDARGFGADFSYDRYPLIRGHVTGSEDGGPVAPLMGNITEYDGGATDLQIGPVTFGLMYCDHVVIYRFTPLSRQTADCDISWLVRGDAVEGRDYDRDRLTWLWDVTTDADKAIIERNQQGVKSRYYEPGPYSHMEDYTWKFLEWYLEAVK